MVYNEILIRDCCGKSSPKIKKLYYYNEYNQDNFPFQSDYEELPLLNLLEGKVSLIDLITLLIPYILIFVLALVCIGIWISICCCISKPKCLLKKTNSKGQDRKAFICLMFFSGFSIIIIVLGITILVYIYNAEIDFNGSICSLLMLQYEIVNGQGLLAKKEIYKPYWYGSNGITDAIGEIKQTLFTLKDNCNYHDTEFRTTLDELSDLSSDLISHLEELYSKNKDNSISTFDPVDDSKQIAIKPVYLTNLGPINDNKTYIGKISEEFQNNFAYILKDILLPVTSLCSVITDGSSNLLNGLEEFNSTIGDLNEMLEELSTMITDYIVNFKSYIINFGYKANIVLFIILTVGLIIEFIFYYLYFFHPFSIIKFNIYFLLHVINFVLILSIIYNAVFGIFSLLISNLADIIDAVLSKENLSSKNPRLIKGNDNIQKLSRCLRGNGDLFDSFVTDDIKNIADHLTQIYILYTPIKTINENIIKDEINKYNSLLTLEGIINDLTKMETDYILTTKKQNSGIYDINEMFKTLNLYTNNQYGKQESCSIKTNHIWTTISERCQNNINTNDENNNLQCKLLQGSSLSYLESEVNNIVNEYASSCNVDSSTLKKIIKGYIKALLKYYYMNKEYIDKLLNADKDSPTDPTDFFGFKVIKTKFKNDFINKLKVMINSVDINITNGFYTTFKNLLNDTTKDTLDLKNTNLNLFSWMNCTNIGQNYNTTISTLKSNLSSELYIITYCSLFFEFFFIAELYIMLGLIKNLKDEQDEVKEKRKNKLHHSIDDIQTYEVKETKTDDDLQILSLKDKKKYEEDNLLKIKRKDKQSENKQNKQSE